MVPVPVPTTSSSRALAAADHEQGAPVVAAERARERVLAHLDAVGDLTALPHPHHRGPGGVGEPDRTLGVERAAVGQHVAEVGPHPAVVQRAVGRRS